MKKLFCALLCVMMLASLVSVAAFADDAQYKLGLGVSLNTDSSDEGNAQVDATFAAVVLDADGKILACRLDAVQDKMDVTDGEVDTEKEFLTKMELGDDYNMVAYSDATIEWYDQAKAFEAYVVGMTADEVAAMETEVNEEGYHVTTDADLFASCSISIDGFQDAVIKACNDDQGMEFAAVDEFTLGVAATSTADESVAATDEEDGVVKMYSEYAAVVLDANGVILATVNDATQPQIAIDEDGEIEGTTFNGTKRELKEDYNMVAYGNAIAEWYEQSAAFSEYCVGMTGEEVAAMETVVNEEGNLVSTDETLFAQCTMSIGGMQTVVATACEYAR